MAAIKAMANMPFPINMVPTWIVNHMLLNMGLTMTSIVGRVEDRIMSKSESGAINDPRINN